MAYYATYQQDETGALQKVVINAGVGFVLPYYGETAPPGTLACDGSEISRTVYDELFAVLGTKAGAGDGSTTFNLPDFRGDFIRCVGGNAAELGVQQGDALQSHRHIMQLLYQDGTSYSSVFTAGTNPSSQNIFSLEGNITEGWTAQAYATSIVAGNVAGETRPVNVALLWCIIYE